MNLLLLLSFFGLFLPSFVPLIIVISIFLCLFDWRTRIFNLTRVVVMLLNTIVSEWPGLTNNFIYFLKLLTPPPTRLQAFSGETAHSDSKNTVLSSSSSADHHEHEDHRHTQSVYYGLMALAGIIGFLAFERILTIVSDVCSKSHGKGTKVWRLWHASLQVSNLRRHLRQTIINLKWILKCFKRSLYLLMFEGHQDKGGDPFVMQSLD